MLSSNAQKARWAFAQLVEDKMCHISINGTKTENFQVPVETLPEIIENLQRVLNRSKEHELAIQSS